MSALDKYLEIQKVFKNLPTPILPAQWPVVPQSTEQEFILIDHSSNPKPDFDCYAQLEPNS